MAQRILVTGAANIGKAGVATVVYRLGSNMDQNRVVYDYLMQRGISDERYRAEIEKKGGRIFELNCPGGKWKKRFLCVKWFRKILKENRYQVLHINSDSAYVALWYLLIAAFCRVPIRIVHSHSTYIDESDRKKRCLKVGLHFLCRPLAELLLTDRMACSEEAARWMFLKKRQARIVRNGIEMDRFKYRKEKREETRRSLGIEDEYVIGSIGRLAYQKNYGFLIRVFKRILEKEEKVTLLIAGEGELSGQLKKQAGKLFKERKILFLGNREDVPELLCAMDVFVLPSRFEGLGIVNIEAQACGLPVVVSNHVPKDIEISENCSFLPIDREDSEQFWTETILEILKKGERKAAEEEVFRKGYEIRQVSSELEEYYLMRAREQRNEKR